MIVEIEVPASSANLGVGFDCLALALAMYLRVRVEPIDGPESSLVVEGEGAARLALDESNRFMAGFRAGWRAAGEGETAPPIGITMSNEIPLGRGLGSSAAATVAGLLAARALSDDRLPRERLLSLATEVEGHPDNAAAALLGGFVVVADGRAVGFDPPADLRCVLFVPERELSTAEMRAVLPSTIAHSDAVHNAAGVAAVVAAFSTGDLTLLAAMSGDRLHEPFREQAYPEIAVLKAAAVSAGAFGAALSGAGSSVLGLTDEEHVEPVALALDQAAESAGLAGTVRIVRPAHDGANVR